MQRSPRRPPLRAARPLDVHPSPSRASSSEGRQRILHCGRSKLSRIVGIVRVLNRREKTLRHVMVGGSVQSPIAPSRSVHDGGSLQCQRDRVDQFAQDLERTRQAYPAHAIFRRVGHRRARPCDALAAEPGGRRLQVPRKVTESDQKYVDAWLRGSRFFFRQLVHCRGGRAQVRHPRARPRATGGEFCVVGTPRRMEDEGKRQISASWAV